VILKWDEQLLQAIRANPAATGPTITARALGVLHTATYDAWAAYDPVAKETRPDGPPQQPKASNTLANKSEAISYAAYRALEDLFPPSRFPSVPPSSSSAGYSTPHVLLRSLGYDPGVTTTVPNTPAGVGNLAAKAVLDFRDHDGSNELGDTPGGTPGVPYSDYTGYTPKNQWNSVNPPDGQWHWQPLCVLTAAGISNGMQPTPPDGNCTAPNYGIQKALTPQWGKVIPFSLAPSQYRVPGPTKNPDGTYSTADIDLALADTSNLDDVKKAAAEYWADGPKSEFPPGHTALFAQALSRMRKLQPGHRREAVLRDRQCDDGCQHRRVVPEVRLRRAQRGSVLDHLVPASGRMRRLDAAGSTRQPRGGQLLMLESPFGDLRGVGYGSTSM
jgi:hypothetical protein